MSGPIVWDGEGKATVDGVVVHSLPRFDRHFIDVTCWDDVTVEVSEVPVEQRDLAARAVVAAVKVMRGER